MADVPDDAIGGTSQEYIAFELLTCIAANEGKSIRARGVSKATADRKWLLDTYAECLEAVQGKRKSKFTFEMDGEDAQVRKLNDEFNDPA